MKKAIRNTLKMQSDQWLTGVVLSVIFWLVGQVLLAIILCLDEEPTFVPLGSMLTIALLPLALGLVSRLFFDVSFFLAVRMGETRKNQFAAQLLHTVIFMGIIWMTVVMLTWLEEIIYQVFYSHLECEVRILQYLIQPNSILAFLVFFIGLYMLLGGIQYRNMPLIISMLYMSGFTILLNIKKSSLFCGILDGVFHFSAEHATVFLLIPIGLGLINLAGAWWILRHVSIPK